MKRLFLGALFALPTLFMGWSVTAQTPASSDSTTTAVLMDSIAPVNVDSLKQVIFDSIASLYDSGDGSAEHPFNIVTAAQLYSAMNMDPSYTEDAHFVLSRSINFSRVTDTIFERDSATNLVILPGFTKFQGSFDGQNNILSNFIISSVYEGHGDYASGFFASIEGATIEELIFENVTALLTDDDLSTRGSVMSMGILVGTAESSTLLDCLIRDSKVNSTAYKTVAIGGLVGSLNNSTVTDCSVTNLQMEITPNELFCYVDHGIGMLAGEVNSSTIRGSKTTIRVSGSLNIELNECDLNSPNVGGAVGMATGKCSFSKINVGSYNQSATVSYTYLNSLSYTTVGGFMGYANSVDSDDSENLLVQNCNAYTDVNVLWQKEEKDTKSLYVGGFFGRIASANSEVCYRDNNSYGDVVVTVDGTSCIVNELFMGGFAGGIYLGSVEQCNWYGNRVELESDNDDFASARFGQYVAAGGFVGLAGVSDYYKYSNNQDQGKTTSFWSCGVLSSDAYKNNPGITQQMQLDQYVTGNLDLGTDSGDDEDITVDIFKENYDPSVFGSRDIYAHVVSAPWNLSQELLDFEATDLVMANGVGGFGGWMSANMELCTVESTYVVGSYTGGGMVGMCASFHSLDSTVNVDDLVPITIKNSYARDLYVNSACMVGGLVGCSFGYKTQNEYTTDLYGVEILDCKVYNLNGLNFNDERFPTSNSTFTSHAGGLVGWTKGTKMTNALTVVALGIDRSLQEVNGIGGTVGYMQDSELTNAFSCGAMVMSDATRIGGIVGVCSDSQITNATNACFLYCSHADYVGGVAGIVSEESTLLGLFNLGPIVPITSGDYYGGLIGYFDGNCTLKGQFYSYAAIDMIDSPGYAVDMCADFLKAVMGTVKTITKKNPFKLIISVAGAVTESVVYFSSTKPKGASGGLFGQGDNNSFLVNLTAGNTGSLFLWDGTTTKQSNGESVFQMTKCRSTTKDLISSSFPTESQLYSDASNTFEYYVPYECSWLYTTMQQDVPKF